MYLWRKLQMSRLQYSGLGAKKGDSGCAFRVVFFPPFPMRNPALSIPKNHGA